MKAIRLQQQGGAEQMVYEDAPQPEPAVGEVLVRVCATAVTPTELAWGLTWMNYEGEARTFPIPGHEFSGVIFEAGAGVRDVAVGDEVYGLNDWTVDGALAEYVIAAPAQIAPKPASISHQLAAAVPLSALTAWQALIIRANISKDHSVLIHGAAGGVGNFGVQLSKWRGAHVVATASVGNLDFVRQSGADEVIDYRQRRFEDIAANVDVIFDTVGGETLERSIAMLKPDARLISVATESSETEYFFYVEPNHEQLVEIAGLIDAGTLKPVIDKVMPLEQARHAYEAKAKRGKVVLSVEALTDAG
jgi:NADPH:quinone reductase-like Zn-dependent oxidoreductase